MSKTRATIIAEKDGQRRKLFKVWFGQDGSYYVTAPYHSAKTATLWKRTVGYDTPFGKMAVDPLDTVVDVATLDDDEGRLKLSHHPDGFCQFSGQGILSGRDENGQIKGVGVCARALSAIRLGFGPVFIALVYGLHDFDLCSEVGLGDILFQIDDLAPTIESPVPAVPGGEEAALRFPAAEGLWIEGFYFQPEFRRFIERGSDGLMRILMPHPTGIVIPLVTILAPVTCNLPGFLGLYACRQVVRLGAGSGFAINGPAENYRQDSHGHRLGDVIACHFPRTTVLEGLGGRDIRYAPEGKS